jgi:hypothetical protein
MCYSRTDHRGSIIRYMHFSFWITKTTNTQSEYNIFVNCNWVVTRWQQYSTHLHTDNTQNDTTQTIHRTTQQYVIPIAFSRQQCLHERAPLLRCTYCISCCYLSPLDILTAHLKTVSNLRKWLCHYIYSGIWFVRLGRCLTLADGAAWWIKVLFIDLNLKRRWRAIYPLLSAGSLL